MGRFLHAVCGCAAFDALVSTALKVLIGGGGGRVFFGQVGGGGGGEGGRIWARCCCCLSKPFVFFGVGLDEERYGVLEVWGRRKRRKKAGMAWMEY